MTTQQIRAQYRRNAAQLDAMSRKARMLGRKLNGYTWQELEDKATECFRRAGA